MKSSRISLSRQDLLLIKYSLSPLRNSRREAQRFGDTAHLLRQESQALEERLGIVNRELAMAREFLGSQSRELDSLGRVASERISTHAAELQSLIQTNGAQVDAIASVSDTALNNMSKLRDDLPVDSRARLELLAPLPLLPPRPARRLGRRTQHRR